MEDLGKNQLEDEVVIPPLDGVLAERWSLGKFRRMLGVFGPAAILASVAVGAGETIPGPDQTQHVQAPGPAEILCGANDRQGVDDFHLLSPDPLTRQQPYQKEKTRR